MALIVETGSGVANANSFVSLDDSDIYHEGMNNTSWLSLTDEVKEAALIKAGMYLNSLNYKGMTYTATQTMCFPRANIYTNDGWLLSDTAIPNKVKYAQMEAAYIETVTANILFPNLDRGGAIKREKVDVIETEYFDGAPSTTKITIVKSLLRDFLRSSVSVDLQRS